MGYGGSCGGCGFSGGFALLVVLFILLIIVGSFLLLLKTIGKDTHMECLFFRVKCFLILSNCISYTVYFFLIRHIKMLEGCYETSREAHLYSAL